LCHKVRFICSDFLISIDCISTFECGLTVCSTVSVDLWSHYFVTCIARTASLSVSLAVASPGDLFLSFFAHRCHFLSISLGCHPSPFYLSDLVSPLFFCKFAHNFFPSGVTPWRVSPVSPGSAPSP